MKRHFILLSALFSIVSGLHAQSFELHRDSLKTMMEQLIDVKDIAQKNVLMNNFTACFAQVLQQENAMNYAFDSIPAVRKIISENGRIRIFTWSMSTVWGRYQYYGIMQWKENEKVHTIILDDKKHMRDSLEQATFIAPDWHGVLYYQIVEKQVNGEDYYLLIGFDFNNSITYKNSLETLVFEDGEPIFGIPIVSDGEKEVCRLIFEYRAEAQFFLRYLPLRDMVVFTRLMPLRPELNDDKRFYVPSEVCDALQFQGGQWRYVKDIMLSKEDMEK